MTASAAIRSDIIGGGPSVTRTVLGHAGSTVLEPAHRTCKAEAVTVQQTPRRRGRPRNPDVEPRVFEAALAVYAERGWYGFSFEAVCRRAGVGPAAIYRRWSSKSELLAAAILAAERPLPELDTGSSREDFLTLARHLMLLYRGPSGIIGLRMVLDARTNPELGEQLVGMTSDARAHDIRRVVERALARGDLRQPTSTRVVLNTLIGATLSHVLLAPMSEDEARVAEQDEVFLARLVDSLLEPAKPARRSAG
jgi:AcrR family transcriptional regulator